MQHLVRYTYAHHGDLTLTARSAGTDMSGGPLTRSVVVDMLSHFNAPPTVDAAAKTATTQPGVYYRDFEKATLQYNLLLPCYTASREINTVGGMVANNSGGEKSLTYGKTEHWVRSVDMVLDDGSVHTFTKLSRTELEDIKKQNTRAGEIYRAMDALLATHTDALAAAKPQVSKDSTGYALWNVHDVANDTFDLTRVITGSQGTLGLITNITFGLIQPKPHAQMLVIFLRPKHMAQLGSIVNTVLQYKPESFESYDDRTFLVSLFFFILKKNGFASRVLGVDSNPAHADQALRFGLVDEIVSLEEAGSTDLLALSIPVDGIARILPGLLDRVNPGTTVFDLGSTKEKIGHAVSAHPSEA
jgi:FAD/FMN-containing dehydrogenase